MCLKVLSSFKITVLDASSEMRGYHVVICLGSRLEPLFRGMKQWHAKGSSNLLSCYFCLQHNPSLLWLPPTLKSTASLFLKDQPSHQGTQIEVGAYMNRWPLDPGERVEVETWWGNIVGFQKGIYSFSVVSDGLAGKDKRWGDGMSKVQADPSVSV